MGPRIPGSVACLCVLGLLAAPVALSAPLAPEGAKSLEGRIRVPAGWRFQVYATGLAAPRLMQRAPDGSIIVTVTGADAVVKLDPDRDGDGKADRLALLVEGLDGPHGVLLEGRALYIAERTRIVRFDYDGSTLTGPATVADGLPSGGGHSTRTLGRGPDGNLYVTAGSSCNVCIERDEFRAAMMQVSSDGKLVPYASGLRNTVGFDWQPSTGDLYGVDNGRDRLGDDVPPDELNRIVKGGHYGWPFRYGNNERDPKFGDEAPQGLATLPPAYRFGAHVAPLAVRFLKASRDPSLTDAALVTKHGSWNRSRKAGYEVVALRWRTDGSIEESPFMTGCLDGDEVYCRPVDVIEAPDGTLYVSDDSNGAVYRLTYSP